MRAVIQGTPQNHRFADLFRQDLGVVEHDLAGLVVSGRVGGPSSQCRDEGKGPRLVRLACVLAGGPVLHVSGGVVASCPGSHAEQVLGQGDKLQVMQAWAASS